MWLQTMQRIGFLCGALLACCLTVAVCGAALGAVEPTLVQVPCAPLEVAAPLKVSLGAPFEVTAPLEVSLGVLKVAVAAPPPLELMHWVDVAMWRR